MKLKPQASCTAFCRGQMRLFEGLIHFWEPNSREFQAAPDEWVFCVEGPISVRHHGAKVPSLAKVNADFLVSVLQGALEDRRVGRLIRWDASTVAFLQFNGRGTISLVEGHELDTPWAAFSFAGGDEVFSRSAHNWVEQLRDRMNDESSDVSFAARWSIQDKNERAEQLIELCSGDWIEVKQSAGWILALEGLDYLAHRNEESLLYFQWNCFDGQFSFSVDDEGDEFHTKRELLWKTWQNFFNPVFNYKVAEQYTAARELARYRFRWRSSLWSVSLSHHEQLETRLQLRDWLSQRAGLSSERIAELLA